MASENVSNCFDEYQGQEDDKKEEEEKQKLIAHKRAELSELEPSLKINDEDGIFLTYNSTLSTFCDKSEDDEDPFFLSIDCESPRLDIDDLADDDVLFADEDDYRGSVEIRIDKRFVDILDYYSFHRAFKKIHLCVKNIKKTIECLDFLAKYDLLNLSVYTKISDVSEIFEYLDIYEPDYESGRGKKRSRFSD